MVTPLKIGIAGCGIGGLALGALMSKHGHRVRIFDQFDAPAPVGSGLVVQPVGLQVLNTIGAAQAVLQNGAKITHMYGEEAQNGKIALDVSYGTRFGLAIHRASLFQALLDAATDHGCHIIPSTRIAQTKRRYFITDKGEDLGPFDLLVDASGARSAISPLKTKPLKYGALWANVDWPSNTALPHSQLTQCYHRASSMAGILPIGTLPGETVQKAAVFWSMKVSDFEAWRAAPIESWKDEAHRLWPEFGRFVEPISQHSDLTMARYRHGSLTRKYGEGIAYIGDAAHCASPQLGQGANMALLDAYALGTALLSHPAAEALKAYSRSRHRHIFSYQMMSRFLTPLYQSDSRMLPWLRNHILAPIGARRPFSTWLTRVASGDIIRPIRGVDLAQFQPDP